MTTVNAYHDDDDDNDNDEDDEADDDDDDDDDDDEEEDDLSHGCFHCINNMTLLHMAHPLQTWNDERISWDPAQFCGISQVSIPKAFLWKPDIFIFEM